MSVAITIPTYNESKNLEQLIRKIIDLRIPESVIVIIDDNSPDGTGELADRLGHTYENVRVIHRERKEGIGRAYSDAFLRLLRTNEIMSEKPSIIVQIDADLSHDPSEIPKFLEKIKECDVVLGSRYIAGGGIRNWNIVRRWISLIGNIYARSMLGLSYRDLTSGFKCFRSNVLENIHLESVDSLGYCFQIETTYRAHRHGYKICEVPILFTERVEGNSKFDLGIIIESFLKVARMRNE